MRRCLEKAWKDGYGSDGWGKVRGHCRLGRGSEAPGLLVLKSAQGCLHILAAQGGERMVVVVVVMGELVGSSLSPPHL